MRILFDSNTFDKMSESERDINLLISNPDIECYITSIQIEEIGNIPDNNIETRIRDLLALCKIRAHLSN